MNLKMNLKMKSKLKQKRFTDRELNQRKVYKVIINYYKVQIYLMLFLNECYYKIKRIIFLPTVKVMNQTNNNLKKGQYSTQDNMLKAIINLSHIDLIKIFKDKFC